MTIEKSKLFFVIPKTISVIPYPYNYFVSYSLSLKLFCQLSLIPKTPKRASFVCRINSERLLEILVQAAERVLIIFRPEKNVHSRIFERILRFLLSTAFWVYINFSRASASGYLKMMYLLIKCKQVAAIFYF